GAALVDVEDDVALHAAAAASVADKGLRDDGAVFRQVVLEIAADGAVPVDVGDSAGAGGAGGAVQGALHGGTGVVGEFPFQVVDDATHDGARCFAGAFRHDVFEGQQGAHQVDVGFDGVHHFRFEQQGGEVEPGERVVLDDPDHAAGEIGADVAEPAGHGGCVGVEACAAFPWAAEASPGVGVVVEGGEGRVDSGVVAVEHGACGGGCGSSCCGAGGFGGFAEDEPPAAGSFGQEWGGFRTGGPGSCGWQGCVGR